ncbi:hypothetical protein Aperf_G00000113481 [Anoplocephala perfoliata]
MEYQPNNVEGRMPDHLGCVRGPKCSLGAVDLDNNEIRLATTNINVVPTVTVYAPHPCESVWLVLREVHQSTTVVNRTGPPPDRTTSVSSGQFIADSWTTVNLKAASSNATTMDGSFLPYALMIFVRTPVPPLPQQFRTLHLPMMPRNTAVPFSAETLALF